MVVVVAMRSSVDGRLVSDFRFAIAWPTVYDNMLLRSSASYSFRLLLCVPDSVRFVSMSNNHEISRPKAAA